MGSHPVSFTVKGDEAKVRTAFKQKWNDDRIMYGSDSYNGSFSTLNGIIFVTQIFDNIEAAQNHLDEYNEKRGQALSVIFLRTGRTAVSARLLVGRTRATAVMNPESSSTAKRTFSILVSRGTPVWFP